MNLHGIAGPIIAAVNPMVSCTIKLSTGYTIAADGKQVPSYSTVTGIPCQFQALTNPELRMLDALNIEGSNASIYVNGQLDGVNRPAVKGGDLVVTPGDDTYLVTQVMENWPDWCKVAATLQNGG